MRPQSQRWSRFRPA